MIIWPFVSKKQYDALMFRFELEEKKANYTRGALRVVQDQLRAANRIIAKQEKALEEARKNDHRGEDGRFVSAKRADHIPNCNCFACRPKNKR